MAAGLGKRGGLCFNTGTKGEYRTQARIFGNRTGKSIRRTVEDRNAVHPSWPVSQWLGWDYQRLLRRACIVDGRSDRSIIGRSISMSVRTAIMVSRVNAIIIHNSRRISSVCKYTLSPSHDTVLGTLEKKFNVSHLSPWSTKTEEPRKETNELSDSWPTGKTAWYERETQPLIRRE